MRVYQKYAEKLDMTKKSHYTILKCILFVIHALYLTYSIETYLDNTINYQQFYLDINLNLIYLSMILDKNFSNLTQFILIFYVVEIIFVAGYY